MAAKKTEAAPEALDLRANEGKDLLSGSVKITDADLRSISSFEDAFALAESLYGDTIDVTKELGNGFTLTTDKSLLVNKPFMILNFAFNDGDFGAFASIAAVTKDGEKFIFNDGSTGVCDQLMDLTRTFKRSGGFLAPHGLSQSDYETCFNCNRGRSNAAKQCKHCGDTSERRNTGTTFYLNLTPAPAS